MIEGHGNALQGISRGRPATNHATSTCTSGISTIPKNRGSYLQGNGLAHTAAAVKVVTPTIQVKQFQRGRNTGCSNGKHQDRVILGNSSYVVLPLLQAAF